MVRISPTVFAASLIAIAAADSSPVVGRAGSGLLHARQSLQYPDSCISLCKPISQTVDACPDANCAAACTTDNEKAFNSCLECAVAAGSPSEILNNYVEFCAKNGPANPQKRQAAAASTTATSTSASASASVSAGVSAGVSSGVSASASGSTASGASNSGSTATTSTSTTAPATTSASKSGAIGVRARAEVLSILFSLSLMAVLLL